MKLLSAMHSAAHARAFRLGRSQTLFTRVHWFQWYLSTIDLIRLDATIHSLGHCYVATYIHMHLTASERQCAYAYCKHSAIKLNPIGFWQLSCSLWLQLFSYVRPQTMKPAPASSCSHAPVYRA